jgi:GntR family transcriptional regulator
MSKARERYEEYADISLGSLSQRSLASRAKQVILEAILTNKFKNRLPPEEELARMLQVSRTTVRAALQNLERDGLIKRRRALGSAINRHVGPSVLALQRLVGFDRLLKEYGYQIEVRTKAANGTVPEDFVEPFGLEPGGPGWVLKKKYMADGKLAIWIRDFVPASVVPSEIPDPIPPSLFDFSREHFDVPIDHAVAAIEPMVKTDNANATALDLELHEPFIRLHETHYSGNADPLAYSVIDIDTRLVSLGVFRSQ